MKITGYILTLTGNILGGYWFGLWFIVPMVIGSVGVSLIHISDKDQTS